MQYTDLPPIYRQVEWLEGKGAQYINIGILPRSGLAAHYAITFTEQTISQVCAAGDAGYRFYFPYLSSDNRFAYGYGSGLTAIPTEILNVHIGTKYDILAILNNGDQRVYLDNVEIHRGANTGSPPSRNLFLFASNNISSSESSRRYAYAKIHTFSLSDSITGNLLANYIPCVRKSDGKPGMYDTVSRMFKTNSGSGEFAVPV